MHCVAGCCVAPPETLVMDKAGCSKFREESKQQRNNKLGDSLHVRTASATEPSLRAVFCSDPSRCTGSSHSSPHSQHREKEVTACGQERHSWPKGQPVMSEGQGNICLGTSNSLESTAA